MSLPPPTTEILLANIDEYIDNEVARIRRKAHEEYAAGSQISKEPMSRKRSKITSSHSIANPKRMRIEEMGPPKTPSEPDFQLHVHPQTTPALNMTGAEQMPAAAKTLPSNNSLEAFVGFPESPRPMLVNASENEREPGTSEPEIEIIVGATSPSSTTSSYSEKVSGTAQVPTTNMSDREYIQLQYETIQDLRRRMKEMKKELRAFQRVSFVEDRKPRIQIIYRVSCDCDEEHPRLSAYEDHPEFVGPVDGTTHISARLRIGEVDTFLDRNREVALLVYKDFVCRESSAERRRLARIARQTNLPPSEDRTAILCSESFSIISAPMCSALKEVFKAMPNVACYPKVEVRELTTAPYIFYYHDKAAILDKITHMSEEAQEELDMLTTYLEESSAEDFRMADEQFGTGLISTRTMQYLFEPGQIIVRHDSGEFVTYHASSYLMQEKRDLWTLRAWSWRFDGNFWKEHHVLQIRSPGRLDDVVSIDTLETYPLYYSSNPELESRLRKRGHQFWSCRFRKYVCYADKDIINVQQVSEPKQSQ
jgi:hypothetical protein